MKKKIFPLLCAVILCLGLLTTALSSSSQDTICFIALNDKLEMLEDQFIPIAISGQYYIPYTVLNPSLAEQDLGVYSFYNATLRTLTVYNQDLMLIFNLTDDTCTDRAGVRYSVRAVTRNGRIYIPARFTCEYFGLYYSTSVSTYGPLVRIWNDDAVISESDYIGLAQLIMEFRLREWRRTHSQVETPSATPTPTPTATPVPSQPVPSQPVPSQSIPPATSPDPVDKSDVRTYLVFQADRIDGLETLLLRLGQNRLNALFCFPAEELAGYDEAVRQVLCAGHAVGLLTGGTTAEEVIAQAEAGRRQLAQIAHLSTNTILAPGVEDREALEALAEAGLLCLNPDVDALPDGRTAYTQANAVLGQADQFRSRMILLSDASTAGAALTWQILPALFQNGYDIRPVWEIEISITYN